MFLDNEITPELIQLLDQRLLSDTIGCFKNALTLIQLKAEDSANYSLLIDTTTRVSKIIQNKTTSATVQVNQFKEDIEIKAHNELQNIHDVQDQWLLNLKVDNKCFNFASYTPISSWY